MKNLGQLMKQAQDMQSRMAEMQEKLGDMEVIGTSGGGMVEAVLNGKGELKRMKIDPTLISPSDSEVLEDLVVAAVNDAKGKGDEKMKTEMSQFTGGLQLPPGFKLPF
jgi:DNA-binding YbaB/EbfC family protein